MKYKCLPSYLVHMPLADNFNQLVCIDLNGYVYEKSWILHMIVSVTKYYASCLISSKLQDEIVQDVYLTQIAYFGEHKMFLSNNDSKFSNDKYREINEILN